MWIVNGFVIIFILLFILVFVYAFLAKTGIFKEKGKDKKTVSKTVKSVLIILVSIILGTSIIFQVAGFRMDFAGGQHVIIPTAVDTDFWGNYKVYYKTTIYESNLSESYYMIEKARTDLADQVKNLIKERKQIVVYYDRWVGFKGISAPNEAPIIKIEKFE